jgi:hypothetical protein
MDITLKHKFLEQWNRYFPGAEIPIVFYYEDNPGESIKFEPPSGNTCVICDLSVVGEGHSIALEKSTIRCGGGRRYLGFTHEMGRNFPYFLSCGIPDELEGERYKKSPQLVEQWLKENEPFEAPAKYIVFKRWDQLKEGDSPIAVIFFASADVLSGLFTLAAYDETELDATVAPFGSGCASIVAYPYKESLRDRQRAVIGLFDVSARPCIPKSTLSFSVPMAKFTRMVGNMQESFLITSSWEKIRTRIESPA